MGYSAALFLSSIVLAPIVLAIAALAFVALKRFHFIPSGWAGAPSFSLLVCGSYGLIYLYSSVQILIIQPAVLQQEYLGHVYGTPLDLRAYSHWGFQDPGDEWTYAVAANDLTELQARCTPERPDHFHLNRCFLHSAMDASRYADVFIEDRQLHMIDASH